MRFNSLTLAVLATSVAAIPHRRNAHQHPVRRDVEVVTTSIVAIQKAVLYVDQNGNPVATSVQPVDAEPTDPTVDAADDRSPWSQAPSPYGSAGYSQPTPTPSSEESSSEAPFTPAPQSTEAPPAYSQPSPDSSSVAPPQSNSSSEGSPESGGVEDVTGYSIAYAPYNGDQSCKTQDQVDADIDDLGQRNYRMVRFYGTDCDQVPKIITAAKRNNLKVFVGIWDVQNAAAEAQLLINGAQDNWNMIETVAVGNEVLNRNAATLSQVISGITTARSMLRQAGYSGPVTTVEVYSRIMMEENRALCDAVDHITANCHPFFNSDQTADQAGTYVRDQANRLSDWCGYKRDVVITETGWPTKGQTNGKAVPGKENQRIALQSLRDAYVDNPNGLILFSAFDDPWKEDGEGTFGAEKFWGIYGTAPSAR